MCYNFGNPGFGTISFDNIFEAWSSILIMMTQLYWWEVAHRIEDAAKDTPGHEMAYWTAWPFCFVVVILLSYLWANMFVALVTATFMNSRDKVEHAGLQKNKTYIAIKVAAMNLPAPRKPYIVYVEMRGKQTIGELKEKLESRCIPILGAPFPAARIGC